MSFFTDGPRGRPLFPVPEQELFGYNGRPWVDSPHEYIVPAILPWSMPLGRSERTIVALRGIEVWPESVSFQLSVYSRDLLPGDPGDGLIDHRRVPDYNALLVGVLFPDGRRASSETISVPSASKPDQPVLRAQGLGGTSFHVDHAIFLWPLPPAGPLEFVVQWRDRDIEETHTSLDGTALRDAAKEAGEIWPGLPARETHGLPTRRVGAQAMITPAWPRESQAPPPLPQPSKSRQPQPATAPPQATAADQPRRGAPLPTRIPRRAK
ncbi:hypothetical protein [Amycolatopsis sp. lyj-112]|uniref:hypothetical protein n=1 Tax=Amycolatopsis sp. lyj-112 TaxID=2789288 RepID=UPI00397E2F74